MMFQNRPTRRVLSLALSVSVICILHQLESANAFSFVHTTTISVPILSSRRRQAQKLNVALPDSSLDAPQEQQQQDATLISASTKQSRVYGHLYRHFEDISIDCWLRCVEPAEFLFACGFTTQDIDCIEKTVPNLAQINVHDHLAPKIRFLVQSLGGGTGTWEWADETPDIPLFNEHEEQEECEILQTTNDTNLRLKIQVSEEAKAAVPYDLFLPVVVLLDRTVGPRHAYLQQAGLPHGKALLWNNGERLRELLQVCHNRKSSPYEFLNLCIQWGARNVLPMGGSITTSLENVHTLKRLTAFEQAFRDGLIPLAQNLHTPSLDAIQCSPGQFIELLLSNGANYREPDDNHNLALHWAAKSGNLQATKALIQAHVENGDQNAGEVILDTQAGNDGATPLHWAAYGSGSGGGGSSGGGGTRRGQQTHVCRFLLDAASDEKQRHELANAVTWFGNTPLLWAAWSGNLDIVKLLVQYGADPCASNNKGCSAAHFAAAGGQLDVCKYLFNELQLNFWYPIKEGGSTPLQYAMANNHREVVDWMTTTVYNSENGVIGVDSVALESALGLPTFPWTRGLLLP
jgi:ankyrin repeat protein